MAIIWECEVVAGLSRAEQKVMKAKWLERHGGDPSGPAASFPIQKDVLLTHFCILPKILVLWKSFSFPCLFSIFSIHFILSFHSLLKDFWKGIICQAIRHRLHLSITISFINQSPSLPVSLSWQLRSKYLLVGKWVEVWSLQKPFHSLHRTMLQTQFLVHTVLATTRADSNKTDMPETSDKLSEESARHVMKSFWPLNLTIPLS